MASTLKRSFVLSKHNNFTQQVAPTSSHYNAAARGDNADEEEDNIWDLCRELEDLGGGIQTRLERISYMHLLKMPAHLADQSAGLPPYLVVENPDANTDADDDLDQSDSALRATRQLRQLEVAEIFGYIQENLLKFTLLNLSTCLIFYGGRGVGKSTFMFQTSFFNMLTDQLAGVNGTGEGL